MLEGRNDPCKREEYNIAKLSNLANTANCYSTTLGVWLSHGDQLFIEIAQLRNKQTFPLNYCDTIHMAFQGYLQPLRKKIYGKFKNHHKGPFWCFWTLWCPLNILMTVFPLTNKDIWSKASLCCVRFLTQISEKRTSLGWMECPW